MEEIGQDRIDEQADVEVEGATRAWGAGSRSDDGAQPTRNEVTHSEKHVESVTYLARPGEKIQAIANRFGIAPDDIEVDRPANRPEAIDGSPGLERCDVRLRGVSELDVMVDGFVHTEYRLSGADLEHISEEEVARVCLARYRFNTQIQRAANRLAEVKPATPSPGWRRKSIFASLAVEVLTFVSLCGMVLGGLALLQLLIGLFVTDYSGWSWVWPGFLLWLAAFLLALIVAGISVGIVRRAQRSVTNDQWNARRRDFLDAVRSFALEPAIRDLTQAEFRIPDEEFIEIDTAALTTLPSGDQIIRTDTYREIAVHLTRSDGATIGLRGRRGSGKTNLVRSFCDPSVSNDGTSNGDTPTIGAWVPAPASCDHLAFVHRVAMEVCERTLDRHRPQSAAAGRGEASRALPHWRGPLIGLLVLLIGGFLVAHSHYDLSTAGFGWTLAGIGLIVMFTTSIQRLHRWLLTRWSGNRSARRDIGKRTADDLAAARFARAELVHRARESAERLRRRLTYSVTTSDNVEGGISLQGLSAKRGQTVSKQERELNVEEIVRSLQSVVADLHRAGYRVIVGIDELDKLEVADDTAEFLNGIKSLFAIPNCSFLVTISTSAWSSFEQRGLRVRTVFDSSFDEIIEARPLSFLDARRLLARRCAQMTDDQVLFVNLLAGGVARDLLRFARRLGQVAAFGESGGVPMRRGIDELLNRERVAKLDAAELDARSIGDSLEVQALLGRLEELRDRVDTLPVHELLDMLADLNVRKTELLEESASTDNSARRLTEQRRSLHHIETRVVSYIAFLSLMHRTFGPNGPITQLAARGKIVYTELGAEDEAPWLALQHARQQLDAGGLAAHAALLRADLRTAPGPHLLSDPVHMIAVTQIRNP